MNNIFRFIAMVLAVACLMVGGCNSSTSPEAAPDFPVQVTDSLGKVITLDEKPGRIVSLAPSNTEILFALGLAEELVAVTDYCNYPPEAEDKLSVGGFSNPDIELIISMTPDLVLAGTNGADTFLTRLEAVGIEVVCIECKTINDVLESIDLVGIATGTVTSADRLQSELETRIKAITDRTDDLAENERPKVFYPVWHDPLMSGGIGTIHHELIEKAGGINIAASLDGYAAINLEDVVQENPNIMVAGSHGDKASEVLVFLEEDMRLADTGARQNGRVYGISDDPIRKPGPRIAEGLEMLALLMHPELFDR